MKQGWSCGRLVVVDVWDEGVANAIVFLDAAVQR